MCGNRRPRTRRGRERSCPPEVELRGAVAERRPGSDRCSERSLCLVIPGPAECLAHEWAPPRACEGVSVPKRKSPKTTRPRRGDSTPRNVPLSSEKSTQSEDDVHYTIGSILGRLRKEAGLTQRDLGVHVAVGPTAVSAWEDGRNEPACNNLVVLARALGTTAHEIVAEFGDEPIRYPSRMHAWVDQLEALAAEARGIVGERGAAADAGAGEGAVRETAPEAGQYAPLRGASMASEDREAFRPAPQALTDGQSAVMGLLAGTVNIVGGVCHRALGDPEYAARVAAQLPEFARVLQELRRA